MFRIVKRRGGASVRIPVDENGYVPLEALQERNADRSGRAQAMDAARTSKVVLSHVLTPEQAASWWVHPGRSDIEGIDAPARQKIVKRKEKPKEPEKPKDYIGTAYAAEIAQARSICDIGRYDLAWVNGTPMLRFREEDGSPELGRGILNVGCDAKGVCSIPLDDLYVRDAKGNAFRAPGSEPGPAEIERDYASVIADVKSIFRNRGYRLSMEDGHPTMTFRFGGLRIPADADRYIRYTRDSGDVIRIRLDDAYIKPLPRPAPVPEGSKPRRPRGWSFFGHPKRQPSGYASLPWDTDPELAEAMALRDLPPETVHAYADRFALEHMFGGDDPFRGDYFDSNNNAKRSYNPKRDLLPAFASAETGSEYPLSAAGIKRYLEDYEEWVGPISRSAATKALKARLVNQPGLAFDIDVGGLHDSLEVLR